MAFQRLSGKILIHFAYLVSRNVSNHESWHSMKNISCLGCSATFKLLSCALVLWSHACVMCGCVEHVFFYIVFFKKKIWTSLEKMKSWRQNMFLNDPTELFTIMLLCYLPLPKTVRQPNFMLWFLPWFHSMILALWLIECFF